MVIVESIISWFIGQVLNRFFFKSRITEKIISTYELRLREKEWNITQLQQQTQAQQDEKQRMLSALKRSGISTDKIIEKYDKPLYAILISYSHQNPPAFIKDELEKYHSKWLGGSESLIPPAYVPTELKNSSQLKVWFEDKILKERRCKLKFLILVDLKNKAYWHSYMPQDDIERIHCTIGETLKVDDLFNENQIHFIALSDIIRDGDIAWLSSHHLSSIELEKLLKNQQAIERELNNPSLRLLSTNEIQGKLKSTLSKFGISDSEDISKAIIEEAKFWYSKLH
jgi:hypothetical protein